MTVHADVIVVGAGPAGSATAALLARRGLRVELLERARFPRPKPCAEYLSPEAARVLDRLGALEEVEAQAPARLDGMRIVSRDGTGFTGRFAGDHAFRGYREHGLALPRERLDPILAAAAAAAGARLREATHFAAAERTHTGWRVTARGPGGALPLAAPLLVGADGLNSRVGRRLGLARRGRRRWIALVTHARGVAGMGTVGEMHVGTDAYVGLAPVGHGITNVAAVVRLDGATRAPADIWLRETIARFPAVHARLQDAELRVPTRVAGPFDRRTRRATADGALLVGDAADFYDPFTGEGIWAALRGAELAAARVTEALAAGRFGARDLAPYDRDRVRCFRGKWILERLIGAAVARPALLDHVARRLARRPRLADLLVGVTGDFVPPGRVLRPGFLLQLVI